MPKYRIYINRKNDDGSISELTDECIWVGNVPLDGKSKRPNCTIGETWVEFDSWDALLDAIGETCDPEIVTQYVTVSGTLVQNAPETPTTYTFELSPVGGSVAWNAETAVFSVNMVNIQSETIGWHQASNGNKNVSGGSSVSNNKVTATIDGQNTGSGTRPIAIVYSAKTVANVTVYATGSTTQSGVPQSTLKIEPASNPITWDAESTIFNVTAVNMNNDIHWCGTDSGNTNVINSSNSPDSNNKVTATFERNDQREPRTISVVYTGTTLAGAIVYATGSTTQQGKTDYTFSISYEGDAVSSSAGLVTSFTINVDNADITGFDVPEGCRYETGGTPENMTLTVEYPANTTDNSREFTITMNGTGPGGNISDSTRFRQNADDWNLELSPMQDSVESTATTFLFTVTYTGLTNVAFDASQSSNLITGHNTSEVSQGSFKETILFNENTSTEQDNTITYTVTGKTESGRIKSESGTLTQLKSEQEEPDPTIDITADDYSIPRSGGTTKVYIEVTDGVYDRYQTAGGDLEISVQMDGDSRAILTVTFPTVSTDKNYTIIGWGKSPNGTKTVSKGITLKQTNNWVLKDVDYVMFTYVWTGINGNDLDSFTFVDGLATSSADTYGYTFEKGVGFANGNAGTGGETYVGESLSSWLLKFAGDNRANGAEYTVINFKKLNEIIVEGITHGDIDPDSKVIVYLMGNWYGTIGSGDTGGQCGISFQAHKGGEVIRVQNTSDEYYHYEFVGGSDAGSNTAGGIKVFAHAALGGDEINNCRCAVETYTTVGAFVYDYQNGITEFISDTAQLKSLENGKRYQYGLRSVSDGKITAYTASQRIIQDYSQKPTFEMTVGNTGVSRTYNIICGGKIKVLTGNSENWEEIPLSILPDSYQTVPVTDPYYDGDITFEQNGDNKVKVVFPANHKYSGTSPYGFRLIYSVDKQNKYARLYVPNTAYYDLHENFT